MSCCKCDCDLYHAKIIEVVLPNNSADDFWAPSTIHKEDVTVFTFYDILLGKVLFDLKYANIKNYSISVLGDGYYLIQDISLL